MMEHRVPSPGPVVLHVITGLETGGAERSLANLVTGAFGTDCQTHVVSLDGRGHYADIIEAHGIPVDTLDMRGGASVASALWRLRQIVRRVRPQLIQGWMYHGSLAASIAGLIAGRGIPVAWNIRQSLYDIGTEKRATQWVIRALAKLSRQPRAIVYNSHQARAHHEAFGFAAARRTVIANGFDTDRWRPDKADRRTFRSQLLLGENDILAGFVGRYHPQKDVPTFLKACALAMETNERLHVALVGEGLNPDNPALVDGFSRLPSGRVYCLGRRADVERILPGFDFLCLSSTSEAFPNVIGEAMATGLPCIATDVGDCARLLGDRGYVVAPGNAKQMVDAMEKLIGMGTERRQEIGHAARAHIIASYGLTATVENYAKLYGKLTGRNRTCVESRDF